jgi:UPF0716 family protein affecting phage T7 exclusion
LIKRKSPGFGPVRETLVTVIDVAPGFFTVIVCALLIVPFTCAVNTRFGGVNVSVVAAEAAGGLAKIIPKGPVNGTVDVTVFVEVWMMERVFPPEFVT